MNLDDVISILIFIAFFTLSIAYFSTLNRPDRIELEALATDIADKLLTPSYLMWNVTKTSVFINASSAQNLYPIDLYMAFPNQTKHDSVRARYHNTGKGVGFVYANVTTREFVMLANLSEGRNVIEVFYSDTNATEIVPNSDLTINGLLFSNTDLDGEIAATGDLVSVSYRNGDNEWLRDRLFAGTRYEASSYTISQAPVRLKYEFTNGSATKTFKIYAFNPIIRVNISTTGYTWNTRFATSINRSFTTSDLSMNGTNTQVFSGATDFVDMYTSPGATTTGIAFSDKNMNATVFDASVYRELNISNSTASNYEMYYHHGSYTNGKPYNDLRISPTTTQLVADSVAGIKASKIISLNATTYATLKQNIGASKDFHIQIENASDGTLLLDYGKNPANLTEVVVHRKVVNLLTTDYDFQKMIVWVKTWR